MYIIQPVFSAKEVFLTFLASLKNSLRRLHQKFFWRAPHETNVWILLLCLWINKIELHYCWWLKSCTTWDVWNPRISGIFTISTGKRRISEPSTVVTPEDTDSQTMKKSQLIGQAIPLNPFVLRPGCGPLEGSTEVGGGMRNSRNNTYWGAYPKYWYPRLDKNRCDTSTT